jgi:methionyl aminopeptidase
MIEKLEIMREGGKIASKILKELEKEARVGVTGKDLDKLAQKLMVENNVKSSVFGYMNFPSHICVSVNSELTHGIPKPVPFKEGDLVSIDLAIQHKGYHTDTASTLIIGKGDKIKEELIRVTRESLYYAIKNVSPNITTTQDIGRMIYNYVRANGFYTIKEYGGHGIGSSLHEEPFIPNWVIPTRGEKIRPGMFICIEPLVQIGGSKILLSNEDN